MTYHERVKLEKYRNAEFAKADRKVLEQKRKEANKDSVETNLNDINNSVISADNN